MRALSSRICSPSMVDRFVDWWTSRVADSHVSPFRSVEKEGATMTNKADTSSHISFEQFELFSPDLFSSKTSTGSSVQNSKEMDGVTLQAPQCSIMSSTSFLESVTRARGEYSARKSLSEQMEEDALTNGSGSSYLPEELKGRSTLPRTAVVECPLEKSEIGQNWPTPTTAEAGKIGNGANYGQVGLSNHPAIVGEPDRAKLEKSRNKSNWPTPIANDAKGGKYQYSQGDHNKKVLKLCGAVEEHSAPQSKVESQNKSNWPTPRSRDWKGEGNAVMRKDGRHRLDTLEAVARFGRHDQDPLRSHSRSRTSSTTKKGKLNANWVEQLLGLPKNWTQLSTDWIASGSLEMA